MQLFSKSSSLWRATLNHLKIPKALPDKTSDDGMETLSTFGARPLSFPASRRFCTLLLWHSPVNTVKRTEVILSGRGQLYSRHAAYKSSICSVCFNVSPSFVCPLSEKLSAFTRVVVAPEVKILTKHRLIHEDARKPSSFTAMYSWLKVTGLFF